MKWWSSKCFSPKLSKVLITPSTIDLSQEWRGLNAFFIHIAYYTLWAQHTSARHPNPGRETRQGVPVRRRLPCGAVCAWLSTGGAIGP